MVAAATSLLLLTACGGSHPNRETIRFRERAQQICDEARTAVQALPRGGTVAAIGGYTRRAERILRRERGRIGALAAPASERARVSRLLDDWDATLAAADRIPAARDDAAIAFGLRAVHRAKLAADGVARSLAIPRCQGFSPFEPAIPTQ